MIAIVHPSRISGAICAPRSKSDMQRACAAALLHQGVTHIIDPGKSNDDLAALDVISKLTDRAYDLVVVRHDPQDLAFVISEAHRILRSGGAMVIDSFFGGSKVNDPSQRDPKTVALRDAGKIIKNDTDHWVSTLIPTGDGLLVATKL
jgi:predicted O-methyltransferase YrrM